MSKFHVRLLGRFEIRLDGHLRLEFDTRKAIELLCYFIVYRDRPHPRETLVDSIWGSMPINRSKKYLRQTLWKIQSVLDSNDEEGTNPLLLVEPEWIQINPEADLWLDIAEFEKAYTLVQDRQGRELDTQKVETLNSAVELYRGDFMEGWYVEWCLFERERFQNMLLTMLDKLIGYCEAHSEYEEGLALGERILRFDVAHERTHRRMARLYYLAGNRTAALRQCEKCIDALKEELDVQPAQRTKDLYEQIREDRLTNNYLVPVTDEPSTSLPLILNQLNHLRAEVSIFHKQMLDEIQVVENALRETQSPFPSPD